MFTNITPKFLSNSSTAREPDPGRLVCRLLGLVILAASSLVVGDEESASYPKTGKSDFAADGCLPPDQARELRRLRKEIDKSEAIDEPLGGKTLFGTPVYPRTPDYFPAEPRDIFWEMDWVYDPGKKELGPIDFDVNQDGKVDDSERDAIRGRNTWLLWGGGNETFWGWLTERGYGITDFLIIADSRDRHRRFEKAGLINQPNFVSLGPDAAAYREDELYQLLGLFIDRPKMEGGKNLGLLRPPRNDGKGGYDDEAVPYENDYPPETEDAQGNPVEPPVGVPRLPGGALPDRDLFEPGDRALYEAVKKAMPRDGLDYSVYGYPSGILGLRLIFNPDFFGNTRKAKRAREYWQERVVEPGGENYYGNPRINADPNLTRPFRMAMSCGYCHIGPHPLLPPSDPENPEWKNLSSIIGAQFWKPQPALANLAPKENFLYHFLNSQPPGTIDTSLVSTDQLNNTNVINAIFDVPARLERARTKDPELQAGANLLFLGKEPADEPEPLHCPMVLFPGEDSVGMIPALARVPLNIGVFAEQWIRVDNPVIGFRPQRPFSVQTSRTNSVHWMVNERWRVPYMAAFFTHGTPAKAGAPPPVPKATQAMKLRHAKAASDDPNDKDGAEFLPGEEFETRMEGRRVFLRNCAICHSSKQPGGFDLKFQREMEGGWIRSPKPAKGKRPVYTLPMDYRDWEMFRKSPGFTDYRSRILDLASPAPDKPGDPDQFIDNNFLSNELRIPITLVGTNAARSLATNATRGNVWNDYSSETFKTLPSVGEIRYYDIFSDAAIGDKFGTNDTFTDGREFGGPGYMRPPSLISAWATAPFLHNNTLGLYNHDPSVAGRVEAFEDAITKLLYNDRRNDYTQSRYIGDADKPVRYVHPGDLRHEGFPAADGDPGYLYRIPLDTRVEFAAGFTPFLVEGVVGKTLFRILSVWIWPILIGLFLWVAFKGKARHAGILVLLLAIGATALLALSGVSGAGGTVAGALMMIAFDGMVTHSWLLWLIPLGLAGAGLWLSLTRIQLRGTIRVGFLVLALLTAGGGILVNKFLNGKLKDRNPVIAILPNSWISGEYKGIDVGPIPKGTPVDLLMNIDPDRTDKLPQAIVGLARALLKIKKKNLTGYEAYQVFASDAGPGLVAASKCPDYVLDRGHWFGEELTDKEKKSLIAFLKTL